MAETAGNVHTLFVHSKKSSRWIVLSLPEALERFRSSPLPREWFGEEFVEQYVAFRQWEVDKHRLAVTDWERRRYFEMV